MALLTEAVCGFRAQAPEPGSEHELHQSHAVGLWVSVFTSLGLSFLIYKMGLILSGAQSCGVNFLSKKHTFLRSFHSNILEYDDPTAKPLLSTQTAVSKKYFPFKEIIAS